MNSSDQSLAMVLETSYLYQVKNVKKFFYIISIMINELITWIEQ